MNPIPRTLIAAAIAVLIGGCATRDDKVPGNVDNGPIEKVDRSAVSGGGEAIDGIGVAPVLGRRPASVELRTAPEVITFWVFPRTSRDGLSRRQGFYITREIRPSQWGEDVIERKDFLQLNQLQNLRVDEHGQLAVDPAKTLEPRADDVDALRLMAAKQPWRPGNQDQPVVRTTIIQPGSGAPPVVTTQPVTGGSPNPYVSPTGAPNMGEIERAIRDAEQRVKEGRPASQAPATNLQNTPAMNLGK